MRITHRLPPTVVDEFSKRRRLYYRRLAVNSEVCCQNYCIFATILAKYHAEYDNGVTLDLKRKSSKCHHRNLSDSFKSANSSQYCNRRTSVKRRTSTILKKFVCTWIVVFTVTLAAALACTLIAPGAFAAADAEEVSFYRETINISSIGRRHYKTSKEAHETQEALYYAGILNPSKKLAFSDESVIGPYRAGLVGMTTVLQERSRSRRAKNDKNVRKRSIGRPLNDLSRGHSHRMPYNVILILPSRESNNDKFGLTSEKAKPVIDIAIEDVLLSRRMPAGWINITYHDSRYWEDTLLAERYATTGVVQAYCEDRLDAILGFADAYSLATVSKISAGFGEGVPVITTAGLNSQIGSKKSYPFVTRMTGSYIQMAESLYRFIAYHSGRSYSSSYGSGNGETDKYGDFKEYRNSASDYTSSKKYNDATDYGIDQKRHNDDNDKTDDIHSISTRTLKKSQSRPTGRTNLNYKNLVFMYHDKRRAINRPPIQGSKGENADDFISSHCYFSLHAIKNYFKEKSDHFKESWKVQTPHLAFDEEIRRTRTEVVEWVKMASKDANVIILCASPDTVREIMLSAHELGMATSGEYVFINIDVSTGSHAEKPWMRANDTNSPENEKAKRAYRALKTISLRRSDLDEYKNFETRVKERAEKKYSYSAKTGKEYEMNNFISAFYDAVLLYAIALNETLQQGLDPRNGRNITSKMWNRTFVGITGNVSIDQNGDRYSDYSLLDLDPAQEKFVEVAYYSGASNELKQMTDFHWVGGHPPKDSPICGWDHSKCPEGYPAHVYALGVAALIIVVFALGLLFFIRRYMLERDLAAMQWKIRWEELQGEESRAKEKRKKRVRKGDSVYANADVAEALHRNNSHHSINSSDKLSRYLTTATVQFAVDEDAECPDAIVLSGGGDSARLRSSSSGTTRKISAIIDRKLSIFTRKKSSPTNEKIIDNNHATPGAVVIYDERTVSSPSYSITNSTKKKSSGEDDDARKSISTHRKFSMESKTHSVGSVETIQMQNNAQIFIKTAYYKGAMVAIKKLNIDPKKYPKLEVSRDLLIEFKSIKDMQHDHIARFYGACVECPNYCIVTEYCPKGSLEDILENEKIKLDKMMKYSLLHDLVKGMYYLHFTVAHTHGRLKSSNCVVDSRFILKITDFGLHELHAMEEDGHNPEEEGTESAYYRKKFWTAPEILRGGDISQKGDVYSFALILHEMIYRQGPFYRGEVDVPESREIIEMVMIQPANKVDPFRPIIPEIEPVENENAENLQLLVGLMIRCWSEDPGERPNFRDIRKMVHSLNKDNETSNLVDNLLKRMEQYATNLEGLVEERTQEYLAEKKKVEELLHQLLPRSVADQLIAGHAVQAEHYESVTIYFSDIVGFTALSSDSTPMQVVTLLNDLYLAFDGVVDNFKVYKVETIGDAYMVVSGLPERITEHASQIAQMALTLLQKVKSFTIRHRPNEQLKLRIGIHSGSVVAGVVGSKMPRYCLFGDTVNTSSRMESNGLPLRIHVSSDTERILSSDPDFQLQLRGEIAMKGKGLQTTYWLTGYKDQRIPDFGPEFR